MHTFLRDPPWGALRKSGVQSSFKVGVFGAEPWTEGMRRQIEELLGIRSLDIYGLSEIIGPEWPVNRLTGKGC